MIENVKDFVSRYAALDEPIPYKELSIKPVLVRDYYKFAVYSDVLHIEKNEIQDLDVIQMNYLDFLFEYIFKDARVLDEATQYTMGQLYQDKFCQILMLCFQTTDIKVFKQNNHNILIIDNITINDNEFDDIRRIIMYQNIYDYDDGYISPDIRKAMEDYYAVKNKGLTSPELEDKMAELTAMTGILKRDILTMTYREFENVFDASMGRLEYQINRTAELSGMTKFDKPIKHWIYQRKKDKFNEAFTSYENLKKKII